MNPLGSDLKKYLGPPDGRQGDFTMLAHPTLPGPSCVRWLNPSKVAWQDRGLNPGWWKKISGCVCGACWTWSPLTCTPCSGVKAEAVRQGRIGDGGDGSSLPPSEGNDLPKGNIAVEAVCSSNSRLSWLLCFQMSIYAPPHWFRAADMPRDQEDDSWGKKNPADRKGNFTLRYLGFFLS